MSTTLTALREKILKDLTGFQPANKPVPINVQENLLAILEYLEGQEVQNPGDGSTAAEASDTTRVDGGEVVWVEDLDFIVSKVNYRILGQDLFADETPVTLEEGDPSDPRIDVIAANTSGQIVVIQGTPSSDPVKPFVDPETQLELTFITIGAGATTPADGYIVNIFDEDEAPDWATAESANTIKSNSLVSPRTGTKSIEFTNPATGANLILNDESDTGADAYGPGSKLVFYIKSKSAWNTGNNGKRLSITLLDTDGIAIGAPVILRGAGTYGFDSTLTDYQQVAIPIIDFSVTTTYNSPVYFYGIKITVIGTAGTLGCYIDNISLNLFQELYSQSGRFGVEGEDDIASQNRVFDLNGYTMMINGLILDENASSVIGINDTQELVRMSAPTPENPFTTLQYKIAQINAALPTVRHFTHEGATLTELSGLVATGAAPGGFTMTAGDFSRLMYMFSEAATGNWSITWPTASDIMTQMGYTGTLAWFDFTVSNSGSGSVTFVVNTGITAASAVTGGTNLVVAAGTTAVFRFVSKLNNSSTLQVSRIL